MARPNPAWFLRALPAIYLIAFVSFAVQAEGLVGPRGILPVGDFLKAASAELGARAFWSVPTLFWWLPASFPPSLMGWLGAAAAMGCVVQRPYSRGHRATLAILFAMYLSITTAGQTFYSFQWDMLLLEAGFLAIFLTPAFSRRWLFRWLLFRLMWESGMVKLASHDLTWRNLTALSFHYETQPLPLPLAWYVHQAPVMFQRASTLMVLAVELVLPFLMLLTAPWRRVAAWGTIALQVLILLTGNYAFFNLLTIALCLFLFEFKRMPGPVVRTNRLVSCALVGCVMTISLAEIAYIFDAPVPEPISAMVTRVAPFGVVNQYGLFASMTTTRPEIEVQGSPDGETWTPYVFRYKAGDPLRAPRIAAPYQPRLDWQMWFAALGNYSGNPWFVQMLRRLLEASPPVLGLFEGDPFAGGRPKYVRALLYQYRFSDWETRRKTGAWWVRELKGTYFPAVSLK